MTGSRRLPEFVDEARVVGGLAHCEDCGYSVRFDGEETYQEAVGLWFDERHAGCDL